MNPSLKSLIGAKSISDDPIVIHGIGKNITELTQLPFLSSLDSLLSEWPREIDVYLDGVADEINSVKMGPEEAMRNFRTGKGLLFNDADTLSEPIKKWAEAIKQDLDVSKMTYARALIYATPAHHGTDPHFDQNINFVLQIHGSKKWWIAPNSHVKNPMTRYVIGVPPDPELSSYLTGPLPTEFPKEDATEIILNPGSLLFLPRGMWHKTEAISDALSLNFTYTAPTWIDLLTAALRDKLARHEEWRETALPNDAKRFDGLIDALIKDAASWRARNLLDTTEK